MIAITGSTGMLGYDLLEILGDKAYGLSHQDMDITDYFEVCQTLSIRKPKVLINCAAYTQVDQAENDYEKAYDVNIVGVMNLATICNELGIKLVQISTDYVFDGESNFPYNENSKTNPINIYGISKLYAENYTLNTNKNNLVVRTQWLYGKNGSNFVHSIIKAAETKKELTVVNDQFGCPSSTIEISKAIEALINNNCSGIFHVANSSITSWFYFAEAIVKYMKLDCKIIPCSTEEYYTAAKRPKFTALDTDKLTRATGFDPMHWKSSLIKYLAHFIKKEK